MFDKHVQENVTSANRDRKDEALTSTTDGVGLEHTENIPVGIRAGCFFLYFTGTSVSPFDAELGIELQDVISAAEHNAGGLHLDTNAWLVSFD